MSEVDMGEEGGDRTPLITGGSDKPDSQVRRSLGYRVLEMGRPCLAEFVGTSLFVLLGTASASSQDTICIAITHGLTIMLLIIQFGNLSGGHFNPCVSLGAMLGGGLAILRFLMYVIAQLFGGIVGAACTKAVLTNSTYASINGGVPALGEGITVPQGMMCEAILTFLLVMTVLMSAVDRHDNLLAPVAIGLVVVVDIAAAGGISGAVMNPARAFGPAVVASSSHSDVWTNHYVWWVGPICGSVAAALIYRLLLASPGKRLIMRD